MRLLMLILFRFIYFLSDALREVDLHERRDSVKRHQLLKRDEQMLNQHRPSADMRSKCVERHNFDSEGPTCMQTDQILNCVKPEGFIVITSSGEKGIN
ncbi:hypothetical protein Enr17x_17580 [Gimesia fumaroli]|uniref:Uncharacterized protein n=1 Tax=Gimesia fumaroli TaxID=2527976 RepID=A0A518I9G4_9PLAN|nr:hypothetical protein Enr17x_17580 [Gimesia fumaroli]